MPRAVPLTPYERRRKRLHAPFFVFVSSQKQQRFELRHRLDPIQNKASYVFGYVLPNHRKIQRQRRAKPMDQTWNRHKIACTGPMSTRFRARHFFLYLARTLI
jgi:hypothetical protein